MKYLVYCLLALVSLTACSSDDASYDNPYLAEPNFNYTINLSLPQYANLSVPGSTAYINQPNVGLRGVFVMNVSGSYRAWEAACPNHPIESCSTMTLSDVTCECSCEGYLYELAGGNLIVDFQGEGKSYPLQEYSVSANGNTVRIFN
ncbi:hypothetical protein [Joostella sp. CR20]|uniref:hypothetical protein n=1 Tax=Joostella sp. CR20 TaxID=2804312 RepID=UPI00313CF1A1